MNPSTSGVPPFNDPHPAAAGTWTIADLTVNRIGLGTKRLAGNDPFGIDIAHDRDRAVRLLRRAVDLGINHIDTAAFYPTHAAPQGGFNNFTSLGSSRTLAGTRAAMRTERGSSRMTSAYRAAGVVVGGHAPE